MLTSAQVELMLRGNEKEKREPKPEREKLYFHKTKIEKMKKERRLPELNITDRNTYVPNLTYFHCIAKKGVLRFES
jgi:hypothetical protein